MATRAEALRPPVFRRLLLGGAAAIAVVLVAVLLIAWLSLRDYKPFDGTYYSEYAPISGVARSVQPVTGSEGKTVYFAAQRKDGLMAVAFDFRNAGDHSVRLERVYTEDSPGAYLAIYLDDVTMQTAGADRLTGIKPELFELFRPVTIKPDGAIYLKLSYKTRCFPDSLRGAQTSINLMRVRYSYLRVFHRTELLELPFGVVMQCKGKLPASTTP